MPLLKFSRLECSLFLFPCALLLLAQIDKFRTLDAEQLSMSFNPIRRVSEDGRKRACQVYLKQLALGMLQYRQDYDGGYPNATPSSLNWAQGVSIYLESCDNFRCPTDSNQIPVNRTYVVPSYWMNANLSDRSGRGIVSNRIKYPSQTFLFGDLDTTNIKAPFILNAERWSADSSYANRHLFGANYAFADGHVKWLSSDEVRAIGSQSPRTSLYSWKVQ